MTPAALVFCRPGLQFSQATLTMAGLKALLASSLSARWRGNIISPGGPAVSDCNACPPYSSPFGPPFGPPLGQHRNDNLTINIIPIICGVYLAARVLSYL
jgi:hypothetical protein